MNATSGRRNWLVDGLAQVGEAGLFLPTLLAAVPRSLRHFRETVRQVWFVGAMSLTLIMVCGVFVGMVLALQLYYVLSIFGGTAATGTVVALAVYRELGPVVTALLFAGRAGTAITAEIGLMRATDQLSAMELMAVDPVAYVATPRFLAGVISMPLLCCVFCAMAIFGGHLVGVTWLGIDNGTFWSNMTASVNVWTDIVNGVLYKSLAFGAVVTLIAVHQGYTTPPTSEGVAYATTRTVVASSIAILALDFMLTAFLT